MDFNLLTYLRLGVLIEKYKFILNNIFVGDIKGSHENLFAYFYGETLELEQRSVGNHPAWCQRL